MKQPARMISDLEFAPKGQGAPVPDAAAPALPPPSVPLLPSFLQGPPRPRSRTQIGLRLDDDIYDALRELSHKMRVPMQVICAEAIARLIADMKTQAEQGGNEVAPAPSTR